MTNEESSKEHRNDQKTNGGGTELENGVGDQVPAAGTTANSGIRLLIMEPCFFCTIFILISIWWFDFCSCWADG